MTQETQETAPPPQGQPVMQTSPAEMPQAQAQEQALLLESSQMSPPAEAPFIPQYVAPPEQAPQQVPQMPVQAMSPTPQASGIPPLLQCQNLVKSYGPAPALGPVTLSIYPGRIIGLLGPNGSGKTTLIKTAAGLLTPSYGEVRICGYKPGVESKSLVSYLPERTYLSYWMKVSDAVDYFEAFYADFSRARAVDMLSRLQVPLFAQMSKLSKGTKEKVQLILVMARQARLYLLDEPIAGVDPAARDYILDTIISNYDRNATIVISTHLISDVEKVLDDYIFLNRGQVSSAGPVSAVREAGWPSLDAYFREAFKC